VQSFAISAMARVVYRPATRAALVELAGEDVVCGLEAVELLGRRTCLSSSLWPENGHSSYLTERGRRYLHVWRRRRLARGLAHLAECLGLFPGDLP